MLLHVLLRCWEGGLRLMASRHGREGKERLGEGRWKKGCYSRRRKLRVADGQPAVLCLGIHIW